MIAAKTTARKEQFVGSMISGAGSGIGWGVATKLI